MQQKTFLFLCNLAVAIYPPAVLGKSPVLLRDAPPREYEKLEEKREREKKPLRQTYPRLYWGLALKHIANSK